MAHAPTQYPTPVASGGSRNISIGRALRSVPPADVRQPDLKQPPAVASATGFGNGSGALILNNGSDADQSQGLVAVKVGVAPSASGTIVLRFPVAPTAGQYWFAAEWATLTPAVAGNNVTLTWTGTRPLITGETLRAAYQWAVSS